MDSLHSVRANLRAAVNENLQRNPTLNSTDKHVTGDNGRHNSQPQYNPGARKPVILEVFADKSFTAADIHTAAVQRTDTRKDISRSIIIRRVTVDQEEKGPSN